LVFSFASKTGGRRSLAVWSEATEKLKRALRAEAEYAPKRAYQEQENVARSKIAGGLERSDRMKAQAVP
jgi:hypothetical protein